MGSFVSIDDGGHILAPGLSGNLAPAAVGVVTAGSIAGTTAAGAAPTITNVDANDRVGRFTLNPVTGGGAQTAGAVATVRFTNPYPKAPIVQASVTGVTDATDCPGSAASLVTANGFNVNVAAALTTAEAYLVQYIVFPVD